MGGLEPNQTKISQKLATFLSRDGWSWAETDFSHFKSDRPSILNDNRSLWSAMTFKTFKKTVHFEWNYRLIHLRNTVHFDSNCGLIQSFWDELLSMTFHGTNDRPFHSWQNDRPFYSWPIFKTLKKSFLSYFLRWKIKPKNILPTYVREHRSSSQHLSLAHRLWSSIRSTDSREPASE